MLADLASGQIQFAFVSLASGLPLIQTGKIRPLAVAGPRRMSHLPNVPTTADAGYPAVVSGAWMGLFVPAGTPMSIVETIQSEVIRAMKVPAIRKSLGERAIHVVGNTPEEFRKFIQEETADKRRLAARLGIKAE